MLNKIFVTLGFAAFGAIFTAQAGPPLICHPYNIGNAASLPWSAATEASWNNPDTNYNTKHLSADTLKLLDANTPVLVRMETLRRAAIYGVKDRAAVTELLSNLGKRAAESTNALGLFDYGYFVETIKQMQWWYKDNLTAGIDGSGYVNKALALMPNSADMQLAADRIKAGKPQAGNARAY